ncbi:MAG: alkaline phosphatase family protein, partial [Myxococcales bacterium]|nr:alkaline phosphatase family protein [Myxococcales bacterium]
MTRKYLNSIRLMLSRRQAIQGLGALIGGAAVGCGDDSDATTNDAGTTGATGTSGDASSSGDASTSTGGSTSGTGTGTGDTSTGTSTGAETTGTTTGSTGAVETTGDTTTTGEPVDECAIESDLTPAELLAKVEHIVVICMENRSFDHYYGSLKLVEGLAVEGLTGDEVNPDKDNQMVGVYKMDNFEPEDPPHGWDEVHAQWNGGACDGFVLEHEKVWGPGIQQEVMGYHVREQLPVLYALADNYALCDHWFASLLGPTWPNRYYVHCATSKGRKDNTPALPLPKTIQSVLGGAGISNNNYYDGLVAWRWGAFPGIGFSDTDSFDEFFSRIDAGTLEQVIIIDPDFMANDDHPSHNIMLGQAFIATIYEALAQSEYWEKSLLVITYDEHGGFYDHVSPPATEDSEGPEYAQMGFRVPSVVIGPHVRR